MAYNHILKMDIPLGWTVGTLSDIANITMGQSPEGESYNEDGNGIEFFQGSTDFGIFFQQQGFIQPILRGCQKKMIFC
mgnify:CR=1 FL=1